MKRSKIIGIMLAGGESRRYGSPKAFAIYNEKYFYEYSIEALMNHVDDIYIVSHPAIKGSFPQDDKIHILEDLPQYQGFGPLAGLYTVMHSNEADWYVVLPCDTPGVTSQIIEQLLSFIRDDLDAIIPVIHGQIQPLIAVYHSSVRLKLKQLLTDKKLKMKALLENCEVKYVFEKEFSLRGLEFRNINKQEELKEFLKDVKDITPF